VLTSTRVAVWGKISASGAVRRRWMNPNRARISSSPAPAKAAIASRLAGGAAKKIGRLQRGHGHRVLAQEGFIIDGSAHGPLRAGETVRAASWGADLVRQVAASGRAA